ncbi:aminoglycoside phosphotransferase family protein [Paenibacillus sp.]|uniref:phosphotransferase family protein n=1 Tax=Paenibacillus sp. TaxID=58172 RepID=UPI002D398D47|nr:aminoglycoside phosphotransferase family protein [Paenibacillus sp.]HZG86733.1 aminoglycoside phosphotransferase family protein [Paenibacillus sp.]
MRRIGSGRTADIFLQQDGTALKLFRAGVPAWAVQDEYYNALAAYRRGIRSPEPRGIAALLGRRGIVYEYVPGETLLRAMMSGHGFDRNPARTMAIVHREIHAQSGEGMRRKQKDVMIRHIRNAADLSAEEKDGIVRRLSELPDGTSVCHGDFHPDNIVVGGSVRVIDWMTAVVGSPAADVARTMLLFAYGTMPEEAPDEAKAFIERNRKRMKHEYAAQYAALSGIKPDEVERWMLPVAAARLDERIPARERSELLQLVRTLLRT